MNQRPLEPVEPEAGLSAVRSLTVTEAMAQSAALWLIGRPLRDMQPAGDLGLNLDPEGPVVFALIEQVSRNGQIRVLTHPVMLSVYGTGQPMNDLEPPSSPSSASPARSGSLRQWKMSSNDSAVRLVLQRGSVAWLLYAEQQQES